MINPAKTTRFNPMEVIISYRSWYTLVDKWICPIIQNGIARFWLIQIIVNFINLFIPRKARTFTTTHNQSLNYCDRLLGYEHSKDAWSPYIFRVEIKVRIIVILLWCTTLLSLTTNSPYRHPLHIAIQP